MDNNTTTTSNTTSGSINNDNPYIYIYVRIYTCVSVYICKLLYSQVPSFLTQILIRSNSPLFLFSPHH